MIGNCHSPFLIKKTCMLQIQPDRPLKGILFVCSAFFMFTCMSMLGKLLTGIHSPIEIGFYRNLSALIPCAIYIAITRKTNLLKTTKPATLLARTTIGSIGLLLTIAAVQELPIADATVLFFTSTLILPILAIVFLKETISIHRWSAIALGMIGVIIVAQPSGQMTLLGIALALAAAVTHASINALLRALRNENPFMITFYFFLSGVVISGIFMPFIARMPTPQSALIMLAIGATGSLGQYFITRAFAMAPASLLNPFAYTGLLWAVLFDITIFGIIPTWTTLLGAAIIISASLYIAYREHRKS